MEAALREKRAPVTSPLYRRGQRPPNYGRRYPPEILNADEIRRLMLIGGTLGNRDTIDNSAAVRFRAMVALGWRSGPRVSELLALELKDIDFDLGAITILHGKGDQRRMVPMDSMTAEHLQVWVARREQLVGDAPGPVFCTILAGQAGRPIRSAQFRDTLKLAAGRAGIRKRVHPHGLRHTFAFELLLEGTDLLTIQAALGHKDLRTTWIYLNHLAPLDMILRLRQRAWPAAVANALANGNATGGAPR